MSIKDNNAIKDVVEESRANWGSQTQLYEDEGEAKKPRRSLCSELLGRKESRGKTNYAEVIEDKVLLMV
jgi:hypothetical protein